MDRYWRTPFVAKLREGSAAGPFAYPIGYDGGSRVWSVSMQQTRHGVDSLRHYPRRLGSVRRAAQMPLKVFRMKAAFEGRIARDSATANHFCQGLLHGHHALSLPGFDMYAKLMVVSTTDQIPGRAVCDHHFHRGIPADAIRGGHQLL
jgi:hypothetical protein